jgi:hypothetical protein
MSLSERQCRFLEAFRAQRNPVLPELTAEKAGVLQRFAAKVEITDYCWLWRAAIDPNGYGGFKLLGRKVGAHVASWILHRGDPGCLCVLHKCDNRPCVNPEHLFLGTRSDNMLDMMAKFRHPVRLGTCFPGAKLTESEVELIRGEYKPYRVTMKHLGQKYGVSWWTIYDLIHGRTW